MYRHILIPREVGAGEIGRSQGIGNLGLGTVSQMTWRFREAVAR